MLSLAMAVSEEMRYWVKNTESQSCHKCKINFLSLKSNGRLKLNVKNLCGTHDSRLSETVGIFYCCKLSYNC
jgi:hypothetical protein